MSSAQQHVYSIAQSTLQLVTYLIPLFDISPQLIIYYSIETDLHLVCLQHRLEHSGIESCTKLPGAVQSRRETRYDEGHAHHVACAHAHSAAWPRLFPSLRRAWYEAIVPQKESGQWDYWREGVLLSYTWHKICESCAGWVYFPSCFLFGLCTISPLPSWLLLSTEFEPFFQLVDL